jgi:hypothetical protein
MTHSSGDVPIDGPDVVTGLVFPDLFEGNAPALKNAVIFAAENILDGPAGPELEAANLAENIAWKHQGISDFRLQIETTNGIGLY